MRQKVNPNTKIHEALLLWKAGDEIKALRILSALKYDLNKDESGKLRIWYEMLTNETSKVFYERLGYDIKIVETEARFILELLCNKIEEEK